MYYKVLFDRYCNRETEWGKLTESNTLFPDNTFHTTTIHTYFVPESGVTKDLTGREIEYNSKYLTLEKVELGDTLDGQDIIKVHGCPDLKGNIVGYIAYV